MSLWFSANQARVLISLSWVLALLFALPSLFLYRVESHEGKLQCWIDFPEFWHWKVRNWTVLIMPCALDGLHLSWFQCV